MTEKPLKKNLIYKGKVLDFYCDEVELPDGRKATREYINHPGAAAVLPFVDKDNIVLVKQYRYVVGDATYEIPAGKMDKGETPIECAQREFEEETGLKAKKIEKLISFYPSTAFSNEILHIFTAFGVTKGKMNQDEDEFVEKMIVKFKDALEMVKDGTIIDSKTIIALLMFENILK